MSSEFPPHEMFALVNHTDIATMLLDPSLVDSDVSVKELIAAEAKLTFADESVIQKITERLGDEDMALDGYRSAFFGGALFALVVLDEIARQKLGDIMSYRELWLSKPDVFYISKDSEGEGANDFDSLMASAYTQLVEEPYVDHVDELANKVCQDTLEIAAVHAGFAHTLAMGKACIAELFQKNIEADFQTFTFDDSDIEDFNRLDLTGRLHELQECFVKHCQAMGFDPSELDEYPVEIITEQLRRDFDRLIGEDDQISIAGPGCITRFPTDIAESINREVTIEKIKKGTRVSGAIEGYTIGAAPIDMSYVDAEYVEEINVGTMVMLVLNKSMLHQGNAKQPFDDNERILVGCAVPGTIFSVVE